MKPLKKHLNPSTFIALLALVFAITGGAFAASGNGGGSGAKATASVGHSTRLAAIAKSKPKPKGKAGPGAPPSQGRTVGDWARWPSGSDRPGRAAVGGYTRARRVRKANRVKKAKASKVKRVHLVPKVISRRPSRRARRRPVSWRRAEQAEATSSRYPSRSLWNRNWKQRASIS